jgi:hypothetical protein
MGNSLAVELPALDRQPWFESRSPRVRSNRTSAGSEAGYNGQKSVLINPTDFAMIGPLGDITYDMLKKIDINVELQAADWGSVVQRRATKEPLCQRPSLCGRIRSGIWIRARRTVGAS